MAVLTFVDGDREWVKAAYGAELHSVPRERSFGRVAIRSSPAPVVVPDARALPRFARHPWVTAAPGVRFYAAVPLITPGGLPIGTLAVLDTRPRSDGGAVVESLDASARLVAQLLEQERESVLAASLTCVVDCDGRFVAMSRAWEDVLGLPREEMLGRPFTDFVHPDDVERSL